MWGASDFVMASVVNVNDVLDGHVSLEVEWVDRMLCNADVPGLHVGGQVVIFLTRHLGNRCHRRLVQSDRQSVNPRGEEVR